MRARFFACYIKGALAAALQTVQGLQQQSGFANARVAADQHHTAFDHAATQYAIEFILTRGCAVNVLRFNVAERHHRRRRCQTGAFAVTVFAGPRVADPAFHQGVPRLAMRAFAQPLGAGAATFATTEEGFVFCHALHDTGGPWVTM